MNLFDQGGTRPFSHSSSSSQKIIVPDFSYQQRSTTNNGEDSTDLVMNMDLDPADEVGESNTIEREHMFDKVVTPSDVGKLNRLVIPKQHAEKYFPLDSSTNEKGLLLNFEDRNGKPWRFRYSYWNSSQSYVMTKGWSRFVKEKKLDAGDIVSFQRGVCELGKDRLFIDWRRRPDAPDHLHYTHFTNHHLHNNLYRSNIQYPAAAAWNRPLFLQPPPPPPDHSHLQYSLEPAAGSMSHHHQQQSHGSSPNYYYDTCNFNSRTTVVNGNPCPNGSVVYLRSGSAQVPQQAGLMQLRGHSNSTSGRVVEPVVFDSVPVVQGKAAAKRFRLFGVNMDCPISDSDESCEITSSSSSLPNPATTATYSHVPQFSSLSFRTFNNYDTNPPAATEEESFDKGKASMSLNLDLDLDI